MIYVDEARQIFLMSTPKTSYVCGVVDGLYLGHIYYGPRLEDTDLSYLLRIHEPPYTPQSNVREKVTFLETFPVEYSCAGTGDYREACLDVSDGHGFSGLELHYDHYEIIPGKPMPEGLPAVRADESCADTLCISLNDDRMGLEVALYYTVMQDVDAIMRRVEVRNGGTEPVYLTKVLSSMLDMDREDFEVISVHGAWARERRPLRTPLTYAGVTAESIRGESSHQDHPFLALVRPDTTQSSGIAIGMNLVYSGNFLAKVQVDQHDKMRAVMGIHPYHFRWKLEAGGTFTAPECVLVCSEEGIGGMSRIFHDLYRSHLIPHSWRDEHVPVLINNWEATYMDFNTDVLLEFAREASAVGIDLLVMDDGWFGHRDSDNSSLGDWYVNTQKLPGGLKPLVDQVNALGMKFGIWVEPEMVSRDSDLYRAHPDWAFALPGREANLRREQLVLDLTRPEVFDGVYSQLHEVLSSAHIEYVKWDMNRTLADVGSIAAADDCQGELMHRYMLAVYRMQQQLRDDFPDILLENCSAGGGRFDAGMLYYSPQIWTSDDTDAIERLYIQEGTALCYPLSAMGAHVSDCPNAQTGRTVPFELRGHVAMAGTFGYELDIRHLPQEEKQQIPGQIELFRKIHEVEATGDYYRLASYSENLMVDCWEVVSKDRSCACLTFVQAVAQPNRMSRRIRLQGLDPDRTYEVRGLPDGDLYYKVDGAGARPLPHLQGRTLMQAGLLIPWMSGDYRSLVLEITEV